MEDRLLLPDAFRALIGSVSNQGVWSFSGCTRLKLFHKMRRLLMFRKTLILAVVAGASLLAAGPGSAYAHHHGCGCGYEGGCGRYHHHHQHGLRLRSSDGKLWLRRSGYELRLQCSGSGSGSFLLCPGSVVLRSGPVVLRSVGCSVLRRSWPRHHGSSSPGSWPPSGSSGSSAGRAGSAEAEGLV